MLTTRHGVASAGGGRPGRRSCALTALDPVVNVFVDYRARTTNLEPRWLGGEMWGRFDDGELVAACHVGANLVPVAGHPDDARAFAERALTRGRTVSTIVGPHDAGRAFWHAVAGAWGRPRELRWQQPHLADRGAAGGGARTRRCAVPSRRDLDELYPACVAMYTEEVGVSPEEGGGGRAVPGPGDPADQPGLVLRPVRGRAGWCSRPRSPAPRRTPRRSRASGCRRTAAVRGWPSRDGRGRRAGPRRDRPRGLALRQRVERRRPGAPTSGSGSARPAGSPR